MGPGRRGLPLRFFRRDKTHDRIQLQFVVGLNHAMGGTEKTRELGGNIDLLIFGRGNSRHFRTRDRTGMKTGEIRLVNMVPSIGRVSNRGKCRGGKILRKLFTADCSVKVIGRCAFDATNGIVGEIDLRETFQARAC